MRNVNESINDKNLFKAVFLAGGPGSGKSYIANNMFLSKSGISPFGVKVINSDTFFELGLEKAGLSKIINVDDKDIYDQQMVIRADAKAKTAIKQGFYIDGMLPIIIDGTGKDFKKITEQAKELYNIGYDTYMVFINTSLDVALERNSQRERKVDPSLVNKMWSQVQSNIGLFQRFFGNKNFVIIDNNDYFEPGSSEAEAFLYNLFKIGKNLIESPLENLNGIKIINTLRNIKGKYLSDIMEADLSKMDKQYQRYARMIREKIEVKKEGNMKDNVVEIKEDVVIKQKEGDIILEKGDKLIVLEARDYFQRVYDKFYAIFVDYFEKFDPENLIKTRRGLDYDTEEFIFFSLEADRKILTDKFLDPLLRLLSRNKIVFNKVIDKVSGGERYIRLEYRENLSLF